MGERCFHNPFLYYGSTALIFEDGHLGYCDIVAAGTHFEIIILQFVFNNHGFGSYTCLRIGMWVDAYERGQSKCRYQINSQPPGVPRNTLLLCKINETSFPEIGIYFGDVVLGHGEFWKVKVRSCLSFWPIYTIKPIPLAISRGSGRFKRM